MLHEPLDWPSHVQHEDAVCVGKVTLGSEQLFVEHQGQQQVSVADFGKSCDARWQCAREPQTGAPDCGWTSAAHQLAAPGKAQTSKKRGEKKQGSPAGPRQPSAAGPNREKETLHIAGSKVDSAEAVQICEEPQQFGSSAKLVSKLSSLQLDSWRSRVKNRLLLYRPKLEPQGLADLMSFVVPPYDELEMGCAEEAVDSLMLALDDWQ